MLKILTVGTATRDIVVKSSHFKAVRDPDHLKKLGFETGEAQCFPLGGKVEVERPILTVGGGAANAAVTFARQGFQTKALVKIGRDRNGEGVLMDLKKEGIKPLPVFDKNTGTSYSVILLSSEGERTILNYRGASETLSSAEVPVRELEADVVYIAPGRIAFPVIEAIVTKLKESGAMVVMNPSKFYLEMGQKKLKPIFDNLDVIILNREEGSDLTGVKYEDERGIFRKFEKMIKGLAVMTDGPKGVMVSDGKKIYRAGVYKEKWVADRTGAGDSFGSGFCAGLLGNSKFKSKKLKLSQKEIKDFSRDRQGKIEKFGEEDIIYGIKLGSANATSNVEEIGAQTGILTRREFESQARWKKLNVKVGNI